jgi:hypothetical protein
MIQTTVESKSDDEAVSPLPKKTRHEDNLRRFIDESSTPFVRLYEDAYISNELRTRLLTIVPAGLNLGFDPSIVLTIEQE